MRCPRCDGFVLMRDRCCVACGWDADAPTREPTAAERADAERPHKRGPVKQGMAL